MGRRRQGPSVQTIREEGTDVLRTCGERQDQFRVLDDYIMDARSTTFFDRDGNEIRTIVQATFEDRFYNQRTGKEITGTVHVTDELDADGKTNWSAGGHYMSTVQGEGLVFLDTGTLKYDAEGNLIMVGGHHPILSDPNTDREREMLENLCEVLADS